MSWAGYPRYIRNKIIKRLENRKQIRTLIHLNKKILLQFFAEYPMQEYKQKNSLKIWSENSKDTLMNHSN